MKEFLINNFWFTVISVGSIVFLLVHAYIVHIEQERAKNDDCGLFVSAGQELDAVCAEIDMREDCGPKRKYRREIKK